MIDLGLPPTPHRPDEGFRLISELIAYSAGIKIVVLSGQSVMKPTRGMRARSVQSSLLPPAEPETLKNLLKRALEIRDAEPGRRQRSGRKRARQSTNCASRWRSSPMRRFRC